MGTRLNREDIEAVAKAPPSRVHLENESVETITTHVAPKVRLQNESLETIATHVTPKTHLQRLAVEALYVPGVASPTKAKINQLTIEVLLNNTQPQQPPDNSNFPCSTFNSTGPTNYYLSLLTSEYQNSPKLKAWLAIVLRIVADLQEAFCNSYSAFDLSTAVGAQLDLIGQVVGAPRTVGFQPSGGVSPTLDDDTYRIYLKAKIAQNQWNGQLDSLYAIWVSLFPGGIINFIDNQNMTATIILAGSFTSIVQDLITNGYIIPRPETVQYNFTFATLPIFGFDQNNTFVAGFDTGHFA